MAIKATINSVPTSHISINRQENTQVKTIALVPSTRVSIDKQENTVVRTVGIGSSTIPDARLRTLLDVEFADTEDGDSVIYDADADLFIIQPIRYVNGGTF